MEAETVVDAMKRFEEGWEDEYQARTPPHMTVYLPPGAAPAHNSLI